MSLSVQELSIGVVSVACIMITIGFLNKADENKPLISGIKNQIMERKISNPLDDLIKQVEGLPDGHLKRNFYTILGAEYSGESAELTRMLQKYSQSMIEKLQKGGSL
jgi:hypothetical protein